MTSKGTVLASLTRAIVDYGVSRGVLRDRLLRAARLDANAIASPDARVANSADEAVWRTLEECFGRYGLGLDFARRSSGPRTYGVVALRDMTAATFGDALRRHCRHHRVLKDDVTATLTETQEAATIQLTTASGGLHCSPSRAEAALAPYVVHAREWTGTPVDPLEVHFEHAAPLDPSAYERFFRCDVRFSQRATLIRFPRYALELPLTHAQRDVCEYLEQRADEALAELMLDDVLASVQEAVAAQLERGDPSARAVAKRLGQSVRTLQRRLADEGISLRALVDRAREQRAIAMLGDPELPTSLISEQLGFSEPRAFRRAFARWTGISPDRYRRSRSRQGAGIGSGIEMPMPAEP